MEHDGEQKRDYLLLADLISQQYVGVKCVGLAKNQLWLSRKVFVLLLVEDLWCCVIEV